MRQLLERTICTQSQKWIKFAENQFKLWTLLEQHQDYSENDLEELHFRCNQFMCQWLDLLGKEHMTNYLHIIGAGHVSYFARKYKNLYRFSQQGWEAFNQLIKHFYFNNTNHGGSAGNGGKNSCGQYENGTISGDHCRPLMRLCQRTIMWKLGLGDAYFQKGKNNHGETENSFDLDDWDEDAMESDNDSFQEPEMQFGMLY
jgi:hypothetical protein